MNQANAFNIIMSQPHPQASPQLFARARDDESSRLSPSFFVQYATKSWGGAWEWGYQPVVTIKTHTSDAGEIGLHIDWSYCAVHSYFIGNFVTQLRCQHATNTHSSLCTTTHSPVPFRLSREPLDACLLLPSSAPAVLQGLMSMHLLLWLQAYVKWCRYKMSGETNQPCKI